MGIENRNINDAIPVFFASDENYMPFLSVALKSLIEHSNKNRSYRIHVLYSGTLGENAEKIKDMETENVFVEFNDISKKIKSIEPYIHCRDYYTSAIYFRLFIPELFPEYEKAIYLDCDTVILSDIAELYDVPLGKNYLGAVSDPIVSATPEFALYTKEALGIEAKKYFNSGVLSMNLKELRAIDFSRLFCEVLSSYEFIVAPDQDCLNIISKNRVRYLSPAWNVMPLDIQEQSAPKLVHYNLSMKPWHYDNVRYEEHFWDFVKKTPFYDFIYGRKTAFTAEMAAADAESGKRLLALAKSEAESPENYIRTVGSTSSEYKPKVGLFVFYGLVTVCLLLLILSFNDFGEIYRVVSGADLKYVTLALLCVITYVAVYPLSLCILTHARGAKISAKKTYCIGMTEHFFNGITPFATGGQPFQVYAFAKEKVKISESSSLLLMNFIVFMIATNGFAACALFYFDRFATTAPIRILAVIGFTVNFLVLLVMIAIATSRRFCRTACRFLDYLCRFKHIGNLLGSRVEDVKEYFVQVQTAFSELVRKKGVLLTSLIVKMLAMFAYYLTAFFILLALGIDVSFADAFFVVCGSSFAITMTVFIPTPGASGGIEFAFKTVLASIALGAASAVAYSGMLIWRLMTYYFVLLVSLAFYIAFEISKSRKNKMTDAEKTQNG